MRPDHDFVTSIHHKGMPHGVVGFEVDPRCLLAAVVAAMPPVSLVGLRWAMDTSDRSWRSSDCHSSCMSAAGLAVPAVVQPHDSVAELGAGDQVERHCCIEAKGVLTMHQSSGAVPSGTLENRNEPGIWKRGRDFWVGKWISSDGPNAQCNSAVRTRRRGPPPRRLSTPTQ
jgi:hypothetical protein